jgi:acyl-CoA synthetase (AMP-forming)/AMP-acid ligase II
MEYFGSVFVQVYGAAEVPHPVSVLPRSDHDIDDPAKLGSAGRPTTNVRVRLVDDGTGVDRGEVGEIVVRGPNVMAAYWEDFDATNEAMERDWFHTGDLGTLSGDGYLTIVGRKKDMIISGGMNVYPAQVEDTLHQHPAVREVAVIGVKDERWGERVVAYVDAIEDVSESELVAFAKERIAGYKAPKTVRFVAELPKGSTGKILKKDLEQRERK